MQVGFGLGGEITEPLRVRPVRLNVDSSMKLSRYYLHRLAGTAVDGLLDIRAESLQFGGPVLFAILQGQEPVMDHLAGAAVAALLDLALVEPLKVFPDEVARRHGWLPVAWLLDYQQLIVEASGFLPGPTLLFVKRSSSANDYILRMASYLFSR